MSRPMRLQFPGALFHATSRCSPRTKLFRDDADRETFLDLVGKCADRYGWIVPGYVLMDDSYQLVLTLTRETFSRGFQWLNGQYARRFNDRHDRVGHLIEGRVHAPLIERESYYLNVLRETVLAPVRAGIVALPEEYEWSSHRAILGLEAGPKWLAIRDVLGELASERSAARARYRGFVNAGIGSKASPWHHLTGEIFLGSADWIADVRARIASKIRDVEHPRVQRHVGLPEMTDVIASVAKTFSIDVGAVRRIRASRLIAAWLGSNEALLTNRQIAGGLGLRSEGYVSELVRESDLEAGRNAGLQMMIDACISTLRGANRRSQI
jgi:putative transposase